MRRTYSKLTPEKDPEIIHTKKHLKACLHSESVLGKMTELDSINMDADETAPTWFRKFESKFDREIKMISEEITELKSNQTKYDKIEENVNTNTEIITKIAKQFEELKAENEELKENMEIMTRRKNLILEGVIENPQEEELKRQVSTILLENIPILNSEIKIVSCFRIGKNSTTNKKRPILIKFLSQYERDQLWAERKKLKGTSYFLNEDYPPTIREKRKKLYPYLRAAQRLHEGDKKVKVYMKRDKLYIGKESYNSQEIDKLPLEILTSHT